MSTQRASNDALDVAALTRQPALAFPPEDWTTSRPDPRVLRVKERLQKTTRRIDIERARLTTQSYRQTESDPMPIRRAKALLHNVQNMSIAVDRDELIVGNRSLLPRMGVIAPEGAVDWVDRELDGLATRPQDRFVIAADAIEELRERVFPYWRGRTLEDRVKALLPAEVRQAVDAGAFTLNQTDHAQGHILPDVAGWLRLGIGGLREEVAQASRGADVQGEGQQAFYRAVGISLEAATEFILRHSELAETMAHDEPCERRREELARIASTCQWLSEHPARTFVEALQAVWFLFVLLQVESNASSFSLGRFDQYMWPYLAEDLRQGNLTLAEAQDYLEMFWLKANEIVLLRSSKSARYFAGFPIGFNVVVGGQSTDGGDATNPLSYMCLRAQVDLGLTQPNLGIRIHQDSPQEFLRTAAHVISRGSGMPQVFNDEVIVPGQMQRGIPRELALDYAVVGCVELSRPGCALGWSDAAMLNMTRILELTLFGGKDPQDGTQVGLATRPLDQMESFGELLDSFDRQLVHFTDLMVQGCRVVDRLHSDLLPSPFLSAVVSDCVARGLDVTSGGARHNFSGVQGVQIANVADSLAAVETALRERWASATELLEALRRDFEGFELLRQRLVNLAPKYGNDDDRVDRYAKRFGDRFCETVSRYPTVRGGQFQAGFYTVSAHVPMGAAVGATPDGRRAHQPLADGGLSPSAGRDRRGPTAVLNSVAKLDLELATNGTLLNMKFLPTFFSSVPALDKFVLLLRGFCRLNIPHVQFNVVSADTLRQAQLHPEEFRGLVVRVAGYSAYFTELDRVLQDEIISRTAFSDGP